MEGPAIVTPFANMGGATGKKCRFTFFLAVDVVFKC